MNTQEIEKAKTKLKHLYNADTLEPGDFMHSSELVTFTPITNALVGIKIADIINHFDKDSFKGFYRKQQEPQEPNPQ